MADRAREIRVLPPLLVNQIAAGEVVERPASVVKELVDNALDAGAGAVRVELEQGGIDLVRVSDDGCGIAPEQLPLALAPHATSKVREAADLERIGTMGFRGEALASIASVARVTIRSRARDGDGGEGGAAAEIEAEGDRVSGPRPASGPIGTSVAVRTLFFNTPARRKFLKTPATEQGRCLDVVKDAAMAHCAIAFTVVADGRTVLDLPPGQSPRERLIAVLGKELAGELIEVSGECEGRSGLGSAMGPGGVVAAARDAALDQPMTVWGLVGRPSIARATAQAQHVFLNGRPIRDRTVMHAIKEAFRGLVDPGRHPTAALLLEMHPGAVDVNVHPTKTEVRFRESNRVHSLVLRSVREALRAADLTPVAREFGQPAGAGWTGAGWTGGREILPASDGGAAGAGGGAARASAGDFAERFKRLGDTGENGRLTYEALRAAMGEGGAMAPGAPMPLMGSMANEPRLPMGPAAPVKPVVQVHSAYLVTQDEQGMVVIDQHALHERVMFEKLSARLMRGAGNGGETECLESQRLLSPAVVPASPSQVDGLDGLMPLLARIGIDATPVGPTSIAVQSFPTLLLERGVEPGPFVAELLERAEGAGFVPGSEEALHEVLDMMACKAAVKAGDRLSDAELGELLALRERVERSSSCPHGRPTSIRVTIKELEKRFGRV